MNNKTKRSRKINAFEIFKLVAVDYQQVMFNAVNHANWLTTDQKNKMHELLSITFITYLDPKLNILQKGLK